VRIAMVVALACLGVNGTGLAGPLGQSASGLKSAGARFDVVSIKPCPNGPGGSSTSTPDRLRLDCVTVETLVRRAFGFLRADVLPHEAEAAVKGGPSWTRSKRFTIDAKTEKPSTMEEMTGPLLQDVLRERFKLETHEETHPMAAYDLTQGPGGAKLPPAKEGGCFQMGPGKAPPQASGGKAPPPICGGSRREAPGVGVYGVTMRGFCLTLSRALDRDVIDKTGLPGVYDLHLEMTYEEIIPSFMRNTVPTPPSASDLPEASEPGGTLFGAVRKLGLQLKPGTNLARLIVIDHVQLPDEN